MMIKEIQHFEQATMSVGTVVFIIAIGVFGTAACEHRKRRRLAATVRNVHSVCDVSAVLYRKYTNFDALRVRYSH